MEDGPVDLVQPRGQGILVALAGEDAPDGGDSRAAPRVVEPLDAEGLLAPR